MTNTPTEEASSFTATTIPIRLGASIQRSISFDFTGLDISTKTRLQELLSHLSQATDQWWSSLTDCQKGTLHGLELSLRISAHYPGSPRS